MANNPNASFTDLFGGATQNVNFSEALPHGASFLPIPDPDDNLDITSRKMRDLARVVEQGKSLAVHTGYQSAAHTARDPEDLARQSMTPSESAQYDAWKTGTAMPTINWTTSKKAVPGGAGSANRFANRAAAMRIIWQDQSIDAENASWLTSNLTYALPLVIAVAKVDNAERELRGGQDELTAMELAEVQTAHKIIAVGMDNMNRVYQRLNMMAREINNAKETIQAREHAIKGKIANYKKRKDPINEARAFVGLPKIGADVDYGKATAGGRAVRTNLLANTGLDRGQPANKRQRTSDTSQEATEDVMEQ